MKTRLGSSVLTAIFLFLFSVVFLSISGAAAPGKADKESILEAYGKLPLYFIENKGQLDPRVRFYVKTSGQTLHFTDEGIVFDLFRSEKEAGQGTESAEKGRQTPGAKIERLVFNLVFENAQKGVLIKGLDRQDAGINYFIGHDRTQWKTAIPTYKGIVYKGIYRGIDLKVFGNGRALEYEFIVNPSGNPDDILLTYSGIKGLSVSGKGELLIGTAFGELKETRPYIYQEIKGERVVNGGFKIRNPARHSQNGRFSYGFQVASYNPSHPLIIDPNLSYSTYLGGSDTDMGHGIAVDSSGNAYITGFTYSTDFPTQNPFQATSSAGLDAFITKLSPSGSALVYSTHLGGSGADEGYGIAIDASGSAYVTGFTSSTDFPTQNPFQDTCAGNNDAFITKLSPSGGALVYSTCLGGSGNDEGYGIAIDGSGNACVTGSTNSRDFPTKTPYQEALGGDPEENRPESDVFITKLSPSGNALSYSTYLGGAGSDRGSGIAVDASGNAYVTGGTGSTDFPTQNPFQETCAAGFHDCYDAFITKLSPSGNALSYSTYLGGENPGDIGNAIAVDGSGNAYVTGYTCSNAFPMKNPFQETITGDSDVFITKLSPSGSALVYSTYLGGNYQDCGYGIAVDGSGNAYITGYTTSNTFPTQNAFQETIAGSLDVYVTKINALTVTTQAPTGISTTSATGNGTITDLSLPNPTQHGVCWNTTGNPTTADSKTEEGSVTTTGAFTTSPITGLLPHTGYHVRAFATNNTGTVYGDDVRFTTLAAPGSELFHTSRDVSFPEYVNSVQMADLDGDGHLDMAIGSSTNDQNIWEGVVWVCLGNGDGTFQSAVGYRFPEVPNRVLFVALGDLDGDGDIDIAALFEESDGISIKLSVLLNNGDGTFRNGASHDAGSWSIYGGGGLAMGDFDGNGDLDIALVVAGVNVLVFMGNGDGTFQAPIGYGAGDHPVSLDMGDLDGDGDLDLAVANHYGEIAILLGRGNGTFQAPVQYSAGGYLSSVAVGDLDADGHLDLAVSSGSAYGTPYVWVLFGNGDGTFQNAIWYDVGGDNTSSVVLGDLDGNGHLDIAAMGGGYLHVLLGNGDGTFQMEIRLDVPWYDDLMTGDVNGDGHLDLAATSSYNVSLFLGNGDGTFRNRVITREVGGAAVEPYSVAVGDLDGDGSLDIVTTHLGYYGYERTVSVLMNNRSGDFQEAVNYNAGSWSISVAIGDLDGDTDVDVAVADVHGTIKVLMNNGDGTLQDAATYEAGSAAQSLALGDVDGDGDPDAVVANTESVSVLINNGYGNFQLPVVYPNEDIADEGTSVMLGDLDGDGNLDIITTAYSFTLGKVGVLVWPGRNDGTFRDAVFHKLNPDDRQGLVRSVTIGDLDGDGDLDLAGTVDALYGQYKNIYVLLNKGDGTFQHTPSYRVGVDSEAVALGDIDGDGDLDIATLTFDSANVPVLLGHGDGTFQDPDYYGIGGLQPHALAIGDVDSDGDLDIAVPYHTSAPVGQISVLLNQSTQGDTHTIRATAGSGGSMSPLGTVIIENGAEQTFTIRAEEGYQIWDLKVNNQSQGAVGTYTFSNVTEDQAILATFMENTTPTVTTTALSDIASTGATSGGHVTSEGGASVTARGVCWSPSPDPTTSDSKTSDGTGTGPFTSAITGLTPGTAYHVRAYATNSLGTSYGSDLSFTTTTTTPTVSTNAVSAITSNAASSGGNVTCDGGEPVTVRGVCWGTPPDPTTSGSYTSNGIGTGPFTSAITGLNPETTYHVRAYATNSIGTAYGTDLIFTTSTPVPMVTTTAVSSITANSASSGGDVTSEGDAPATARGVCWSTSLNPTINDSHTSDGTGPGPFTSALTGLSAGTTYHVRAYATNSLGTGYGSDLTFTTPTSVPSVSTTAVSSITSGTAISGGHVTSDGGSPVTARGVCWQEMPDPIIWGSHTTDGTGPGSFTSTMNWLTPGTVYHVRAYATNASGTAYGGDVTFVTDTKTPAVITSYPSYITETTATSGGYVYFEGSMPVTARGVCWGTSVNPTISDTHSSDGTGIGSFTSAITGLIPGTTYHVRAYATNWVATVYGPDVSFTTSGGSTLYVSSDGNCGEKTPCYTSIQAAMDEADTGALILIAEGSYEESILLNVSKTLTLKGGWDSAFTTQSSCTTVNSITISNGTVAVDRLVIH